MTILIQKVVKKSKLDQNSKWTVIISIKINMNLMKIKVNKFKIIVLIWFKINKKLTIQRQNYKLLLKEYKKLIKVNKLPIETLKLNYFNEIYFKF
jgi:hypothetical protein